MLALNKSGPKIEPWGTPDNISAQQLKNERLSKDQLELQLPTRENRKIDTIFQSSQLNSAAH